MKLRTLINSHVSDLDRSPDFSLKCDVLIVGAGSAGIFAARAAYEEGADVILLERNENIGGMRVRGNVTPYYYGAPGGAYERIDGAIPEMEAFAYRKNQPEPLQIKFTELISDSGVRLFTRSVPLGLYFEENRVFGIRALIGDTVADVSAKLVIDSTSDGHLIRMSGAEYRFGRERDGKTAPFTVRTQYIKDGKYISRNDDSGYINQYDVEKFSDSIIRAHANAEQFLRDGEFLSLPTQAGIREGLTFVGEETLRCADLCYGNFSKKPLFYAYSDLDKHGHDRALDDDFYQMWMTVSNLATVTVSIPVPLGAVIPKGIKGLITAGRCLSIDTYALGAVRMNRDMHRMGECIGVAAAMVTASGTDFADVDYAEYVTRVKKRGCFFGHSDRIFGFDNNRNLISYKPLTFEVEKTIELLSTETPGAAIWSCYVAKDKEAAKSAVYARMICAKDTLTKYNSAIALGAMEDERALPVLREIVINRDFYYFKDCRRSNQHRSAIAIALLGRIGTIEDLDLIYEIVFDENEINKNIYHVLKPEYIHHIEKDRNFLFFDIFTHAVMATVRITKRCGGDTAALYQRLSELFLDERTARRITHVKKDEPAYIEITSFFKSVLEELKL